MKLTFQWSTFRYPHNYITLAIENHKYGLSSLEYYQADISNFLARGGSFTLRLLFTDPSPDTLEVLALVTKLWDTLQSALLDWVYLLDCCNLSIDPDSILTTFLRLVCYQSFVSITLAISIEWSINSIGSTFDLYLGVFPKDIRLYWL
jgi:hypothetical protein